MFTKETSLKTECDIRVWRVEQRIRVREYEIIMSLKTLLTLSTNQS